MIHLKKIALENVNLQRKINEKSLLAYYLQKECQFAKRMSKRMSICKENVNLQRECQFAKRMSICKEKVNLQRECHFAKRMSICQGKPMINYWHTT